jgi:hypothetical protein
MTLAEAAAAAHSGANHYMPRNVASQPTPPSWHMFKLHHTSTVYSPTTIQQIAGDTTADKPKLLQQP